MDEDDAMAIGRPATCITLASAASPIRGNNQLMSTVWGGVDKREGQFRGGGATEKGITSFPLNQFQTYLPATPVHRKDRNLFRMCPGSEAVLSAPW
jgi:hypothetical protein